MCLCLSEISYAYICESGAFDFLKKGQNRLAYCTLLNEPVVSVVDPYQDSTESASFWEPGSASKAHPDPQKLAVDSKTVWNMSLSEHLQGFDPLFGIWKLGSGSASKISASG